MSIAYNKNNAMSIAEQLSKEPEHMKDNRTFQILNLSFIGASYVN